MKLKILSLFIIPALIFVVGCSESDKNADLTSSYTESTDTEPESLPVLFVDKQGAAHVICVFENGVYHSISDYRYSGKDWSEYIGKEEQEVTAPFIEKGDQFILYDTSNNTTETICKGVECVGRGIDDFAEIRAKLSTQPEGKIAVGLKHDVNADMSKIIFDEGQITADFDGNFEQDSIKWEFSDSESEDDSMGNISFVIDININGKKTSIKNAEYSLWEENGLEIFVQDIDRDGSCEILIYTNIGHSTWLDVYSTKGGQLELMFDYVINPGP